MGINKSLKAVDVNGTCESRVNDIPMSLLDVIKSSTRSSKEEKISFVFVHDVLQVSVLQYPKNNNGLFIVHSVI